MTDFQAIVSFTEKGTFLNTSMASLYNSSKMFRNFNCIFSFVELNHAFSGKFPTAREPVQKRAAANLQLTECLEF